MKAAIALDAYKLPFFEKELIGDGFEFSQTELNDGSLLLKVQVPLGLAYTLNLAIIRANTAARGSYNNGPTGAK